MKIKFKHSNNNKSKKTRHMMFLPAAGRFRLKIFNFLALADGATQRASVQVKRGKGGLGGAERKKTADRCF